MFLSKSLLKTLTCYIFILTISTREIELHLCYDQYHKLISFNFAYGYFCLEFSQTATYYLLPPLPTGIYYTLYTLHIHSTPA